MPDFEQLYILQAGVTHWNAWGAENPDELIDLSNTDL